MLNRDIYNKAPQENRLVNNGVAEVSEDHSDAAQAILRYEPRILADSLQVRAVEPSSVLDTMNRPKAQSSRLNWTSSTHRATASAPTPMTRVGVVTQRNRDHAERAFGDQDGAERTLAEREADVGGGAARAIAARRHAEQGAGRLVQAAAGAVASVV